MVQSAMREWLSTVKEMPAPWPLSANENVRTQISQLLSWSHYLT